MNSHVVSNKKTKEDNLDNRKIRKTYVDLELFRSNSNLILILIICGIAPISAAIAVAEFSITLLVGAKLAATALERPLSSYEFIGFGFVFGAPLAVAISQLFLLP